MSSQYEILANVRTAHWRGHLQPRDEMRSTVLPQWVFPIATGVASEEFGSLKEAARTMVRVKKRFEPNIDAVPVYVRKYAHNKKVSAAFETCW